MERAGVETGAKMSVGLDARRTSAEIAVASVITARSPRSPPHAVARVFRFARTVSHWSSSVEGRSVTSSVRPGKQHYLRSRRRCRKSRRYARLLVVESTNSALGAHPETLAQEPLQYFASPALRQVRLRELQIAGHLVIRQPLATMDNQCFHGDVHARFRDYAGGHKLSPLRIGYPEDRHLSDRRMLQDDGLDLAGIHVFAAAHDHVFKSIQDIKIPGRVVIADVSGTKEAVPEGGRCVLRIVPVTSHHTCPTGHQSPALTGRYLPARFVRDLHLDTRTRPATGHQSSLDMLLVLETREIPRFTESVDLDQLHLRQEASSSTDQLRRHGRSTIRQYLETAQIRVLRLRILH